MDPQTKNTIQDLKNKVENFKIEKVTLDSILEYKSLFDSINKYILVKCWDSFKKDLNNLELDNYGIKIESNIYTEKPKNAILLIKDKITSLKRIETNETTLSNLTKLNVELTKLYVKYEDLEEELDESFHELYNMIDEKFEWLEEDEEFIQISELLEKISQEIYKGVENHVNQKRQFYLEYFSETFKKQANKDVNINSEIYVSNYIKNCILNNFNDIFNAACLDVMELNNIKDQDQIKKIINLYYDYTKQTTKLMLSLNDIDYRIKMYESKEKTN